MTTTKKTTADPTKELDALENQVANSSEKNRNFFTATLVVFIYLSIVVVQTSDLDLLIGRGIHLPLVDVTMPIFAFYLIAPLMVLALHFNLLQNIENHHAKLIAWRNAHPNLSMPRESIHPFIFDFATLDKTSTFSELTQIINQIVIYWSGPITALLILWRFTDYQSWLITFWHFLALCASLWLVMRARQSIDGIISAKQSKISLAQLTFSTLSEYSTTILKTLKSKPVLFFTWSVQGVFKQKFSNTLGTIIWVYGLSRIVLLTFLMFSPVVHLIKTNHAESFFPRIEIDRRDNLLASVEENLKLQYELRSVAQIKFDTEEKLKLEAKDIVVTEAQIETENNVTASETEDRTCPHKRYSLTEEDPANNFNDWLMQYGNGIDLRGRSIRLANLAFANLRRASLEGANLQGANLEFSQLQGAEMFDWDTPKGANLRDASLFCANLQNANMVLANLQNAGLMMANLQSAQLGGANLQHAGLTSADLRHARMKGTQLQNASLPNARLVGAVLINAQLQNADLESTELQGADLSQANLQNTRLYFANLQNAKLVDTNLINVRGLTNCNSCELSPNPNVEVWVNKNDDWASSEEIKCGLASKSQSKTDDLLAQMRREGWPK